MLSNLSDTRFQVSGNGDDHPSQLVISGCQSNLIEGAILFMQSFLSETSRLFLPFFQSFMLFYCIKMIIL